MPAILVYTSIPKASMGCTALGRSSACDSAARPCSHLLHIGPCRQFPHHSNYWSDPTYVGTFIQGVSVMPLKLRDRSVVGGRRERRNEQVNFTSY